MLYIRHRYRCRSGFSQHPSSGYRGSLTLLTDSELGIENSDSLKQISVNQHVQQQQLWKYRRHRSPCPEVYCARALRSIVVSSVVPCLRNTSRQSFRSLRKYAACRSRRLHMPVVLRRMSFWRRSSRRRQKRPAAL